MTTVISAYEPSAHRYHRLIRVMTGFNSCVEKREVPGSYDLGVPTLVSLHEHKGSLHAILDMALTTLEKELIGVLWELQNEDRDQVTFGVA